MKNFHKLFFVFLLLFAFAGCEDEIVSRIPYASVSFTIDLSFDDNDLAGAYTAKSVTKKRTDYDGLGYGGLLLFNKGVLALHEIYAYDLSCPNEAKRDVRVVPNTSGQAVCPQCNAIYNLDSNGAPASGSSYYLHQYPVSPSGNNRYIVSN